MIQYKQVVFGVIDLAAGSAKQVFWVLSIVLQYARIHSFILFGGEYFRCILLEGSILLYLIFGRNVSHDQLIRCKWWRS